MGELRVGERLPEADLAMMGPEGPQSVSLTEALAGRRVILFALPGAFTGTCSTAHVPSFMRKADRFRQLGIDSILCVSVNDPFVLDAWGDSTGATAAGITMVGDADGALTRALGQDFSAPQLGLYGRSNRYAAVLDDGLITHLSIDEPGVCDLSTGEALLEAMTEAAA